MFLLSGVEKVVNDSPGRTTERYQAHYQIETTSAISFHPERATHSPGSIEHGIFAQKLNSVRRLDGRRRPDARIFDERRGRE